MSKTRILILEPPSLLEQIQHASSASSADLEVVGAEIDTAKAVELVAAQKPDLIIVDLVDQFTEGMQTIQAIQSKYPWMVILARIAELRQGVILEIFRCGVRGVLLPDASQEEVLGAFQTIKAGLPYLPKRVVHHLVEDIRKLME